MAKYYVTMSCGHDKEVVLYGKTEDRERKIKYFEEYGLCRECYKAKMQEQYEKDFQALEKEIDLLELEGSEKQIAWATKIRKKAFVKAAKAMENCGRDGIRKEVFGYLAEQTKSVYWIDRRDWDGENIVFNAVNTIKEKKDFQALEKEIDLPELEGSEKQIAWATEIRLKRIDAITKEIKNMISQSQEDKENDKKVIKITFDYLAEQKKATYWIDRRDWSGNKFIEKEIVPLLKEKML